MCYLELCYTGPCTAKKKLKFGISHVSSEDLSYSEGADSAQPVYEHPLPKYGCEQIIKILLQADESKVCHVKPTSISRSATYVVDVRNLRNQDDIKKDEFGIWNYSGSHPQPFKVYNEDDGRMTVEKCCEGATGANVVFLRRLHCVDPSNAKFKRFICFLTGTLC